MTFVGWLQIAVTLALVLAAAIPMSRLIDAVYAGRRNFLLARAWAAGEGILPPRRRRRDARAELARLCDGDARLLDRRLRLPLCVAALAKPSAAQSAGVRRGPPRSRVQHRDQLHHQHQLAELRRRDDDESSHADARPDRAQFPVRRDRLGDGVRAGAQRSRAPRRRRSATSGSM